MLSEYTPELIEQQIKQAFADTRYPGDDKIVLGGYDDEYEIEGIKTTFLGQNWQDMTSEMLHRYSATFAFLTEKAYRYYLPAYLLELLDWTEGKGMHPRNVDVIHHLRPPYDTPGDTSQRARDIMLSRYSGFTFAQCEAIRKFLEYLSKRLPEHYREEKEDVYHALNDFWNDASRHLCSSPESPHT